MMNDNRARDGDGKRRWLARLLSSPATVLDVGTASASIGPNWFASVMGTGIVANAAIGLPVMGGSLRGLASTVWVLSAVLLLALCAAWLLQWLVRPEATRDHAKDAVLAQFFGAPPMAMMTVGAGALLVGEDVIGHPTAVGVSWILWCLGTAGGLFTAVFVPYRLFTKYHVRPDGAFGGWLMPVVPPMVSATTGGLLIPYTTEGPLRQTMFFGCYAMFGLSLVAALIIITMIWSRLAHYGTSGTARVPTLWVVLGPLGQSITAAGVLGQMAPLAVGGELADAMNTFSVLYGVPVWGFAALWSALAGLITLRSLRRRMPFALTWWAFTFPVGTCVTGTSQLANHTDLPAFSWAAVAGFVGLLAAWLVVAVRTVRGVLKGTPLTPPVGAPHAVARKDNDPPR